VLAVVVDVVVDVGGDRLDLGEFVAGRRQRLQRPPLQFLEQVAAAGGLAPELVLIDLGRLAAEGLVELAAAEEATVAQRGKNLPLGDQDTGLNGCLGVSLRLQVVPSDRDCLRSPIRSTR
jgi:hypothetical protein